MGTVYSVSATSPCLVPGFHLGIILITRRASLSKSGWMPWITRAFAMLPSSLTVNCAHFSLRINGYASYEKAQVTRGGVCLDELTDTLESVLQPGLFFAGEVADVDGTCGGYNLQWAFSSGTVAGRAIVKRNQELFKDDRHTMEENDGISERNRRR